METKIEFHDSKTQTVIIKPPKKHCPYIRKMCGPCNLARFLFIIFAGIITSLGGLIPQIMCWNNSLNTENCEKYTYLTVMICLSIAGACFAWALTFNECPAKKRQTYMPVHS